MAEKRGKEKRKDQASDSEIRDRNNESSSQTAKKANNSLSFFRLQQARHYMSDAIIWI